MIIKNKYISECWSNFLCRSLFILYKCSFFFFLFIFILEINLLEIWALTFVEINRERLIKLTLNINHLDAVQLFVGFMNVMMQMVVIYLFISFHVEEEILVCE